MKDCTKEIYLKFDHERMDFHVLQNAVEEVKELPEGVVVECGTGKGIGTRMIIHGLADTNVKFYSVDPYPKYKGGDVNPYSDLDHPLFHDGEFYREAKDRTIETLNGLSKLRNVDFEQVNQDDRYFLLENEEDIILADLSDDELVEQMHDDLYDGLKEEIEEGTDILLSRGWSAEKVLNEALVAGMTIVGIDFRDGILFVPEVLLAANAMKGGMEILKPLLAETGAKPVGSMVIGTVKGDIHDIGKNLVGMMCEGAGFEVVDIGINNSVEDYFEALEKHKPDILGMSALLTTTMPYMKVVIDEMVNKGIRDDYIVLVGGAPLNEEFGEAVGADRYCRDSAEAAAVAMAMVTERQESSA